MEKKRVFELKYGDVFIYDGGTRVVSAVENGFIYFDNYTPGRIKYGKVRAIGCRSKELVEIISNQKIETWQK
jgi:hypothetical protein